MADAGRLNVLAGHGAPRKHGFVEASHHLEFVGLRAYRAAKAADGQ